VPSEADAAVSAEEDEAQSILVTVFENGVLKNEQTFDAIRELSNK